MENKMDNNQIQFSNIQKLINSLDAEQLKIIFKSSIVSDANAFASFQFPKEMFDENIFETIKEYARLDYEISKKNNHNVGRTTKFEFVDVETNAKVGEYQYEHDLEFLDSMIDGYKM